MKKEKPEIITAEGSNYRRILIKTHFLSKEDNIGDIVERYCKDILQPGDRLMMAETPVATSQGRAINIADIKVSPLANILWRFVSKNPYGVGLRSPYSMQMAIEEAGACRILCASAAGALAKLLGKKGWFYMVAGRKAAVIDAAGTSPLYPEAVVLGPADPDTVCNEITKRFGIQAFIMDINDIGGCEVLGKSSIATEADVKIMKGAMSDNPCGQSDELTPICIIRPVQ